MKFLNAVAAACVALIFLSGSAIAQNTFVQVELDLDGTDGCSILRVDSTGTLSEWVSNADILGASGETTCDPDDTGLAVAPDGTLFFFDDDSDSIYRVSPAGVVSLFVSEATLDAAVGGTADIDNGMTFGSDGNLYAADEDTESILQITPAGVVTVVVTRSAILAATGKSDADLEGGLARGDDGTLYFVDEFDENVREPDDEVDDEQSDRGSVATDSERVLSATPAGVVSVLATEGEIVAQTGNPDTDLDLDIELGGSTLFVLDDGAGGAAALVAIDTSTGVVSLVASESDITAVTGVSNADSGGFDPEGGIAFDPASGELIIGDNGFDETDSEDKANIVRVTPAGSVSLFVSDADLTSFYEGIYGATNNDFQLRGGLAFQASAAPAPPGPTVAVPALSHKALAILSFLLLGLGVVAIRRFA